jgi:hypothetical protein
MPQMVLEGGTLDIRQWIIQQYVKMVDQALNRMGETKLAWLFINRV